MSLGPGKYDAECTAVRELCDAKGAVLIVYQGAHGSGFSCQGPLEMHTTMPAALREIADQIERDVARIAAGGVPS